MGDLFSTKSTMGNTKKLSFNAKGKRPLLHIKYNCKCIHDDDDDIVDLMNGNTKSDDVITILVQNC